MTPDPELPGQLQLPVTVEARSVCVLCQARPAQTTMGACRACLQVAGVRQ